jgi:hypothetical protein
LIPLYGEADSVQALSYKVHVYGSAESKEKDWQEAVSWHSQWHLLKSYTMVVVVVSITVAVIAFGAAIVPQVLSVKTASVGTV